MQDMEKSEEECLCGDGGCAYILFTKRYINTCIVCVSAAVQLLSRVLLFVTPWAAACQASLSIINSQSLLKLMSIESVMPSNHPILCCPLSPAAGFFPMSQFFISGGQSIGVSASASVLTMNIQG